MIITICGIVKMLKTILTVISGTEGDLQCGESLTPWPTFQLKTVSNHGYIMFKEGVKNRCLGSSPKSGNCS